MTALQTIAFPIIADGLQKYELPQIARYADYGYGAWTLAPDKQLGPAMVNTLKALFPTP